MDDGCEENLSLARGPDEPGETWRAQSRIQLAVHSAKVWGHHCGVGFQVVCFPSEAPPARIYVYVGPPGSGKKGRLRPPQMEAPLARHAI